jgi:alcohol dehydrogenase class IV
MAMCSLLGGMALANAKLGAVHGLASVVGAVADVPHGAACAALLAPVVEANVRALREMPTGGQALARYAEAAQLLTGDNGAAIEDGIAWIRETVALLRVPGLREFGLRPEDFGPVAAKAVGASSTQGNPVVLFEADLRAILAEAA